MDECSTAPVGWSLATMGRIPEDPRIVLMAVGAQAALDPRAR